MDSLERRSRVASDRSIALPSYGHGKLREGNSWWTSQARARRVATSRTTLPIEVSALEKPMSDWLMTLADPLYLIIDVVLDSPLGAWC
jgi:hypothetical protein